MAIVSRPAYPEAVATRLVAEEKGADTPPGLPVEQVVTPEDTSLQDLSQQDASPQDVPPQNTPPQDEPVQDDEQERVNDMTMEEAKARIAELETQVQDLGKQ